MDVIPALHLRTMCMPNDQGGQKRLLGLCEQELQATESHHVGARNQTQVFWKSSQYC